MPQEDSLQVNFSYKHDDAPSILATKLAHAGNFIKVLENRLIDSEKENRALKTQIRQMKIFAALVEP